MKNAFLRGLVILAAAYIVIIHGVLPGIGYIVERIHIYRHPELATTEVTDDAVKSFASDAIGKILNVDYLNFDDELLRAKPDFTPDGWEEVLHDLGLVQQHQTLNKTRGGVRTLSFSTPVMNDKGVVDGVYTWNMSLSVKTETNGMEGNAVLKPVTANLRVSVRVTRSDDDANSKGIGVDAVRIEPITGQ